MSESLPSTVIEFNEVQSKSVYLLRMNLANIISLLIFVKNKLSYYVCLAQAKKGRVKVVPKLEISQSVVLFYIFGLESC